MDKTIENALDDISLIKTVILKTQKDFAKVASFFIWIGIINGIAWIIEQLAYYIRNTVGYGNVYVQLLGQGYHWVRLLGYIVVFAIFYRKLKSSQNDISEGMIKIWGIVLIGSYFLSFLYLRLLPNGNSDKINILWRSEELIEVLPVVVVLFMTGILTKKRIISVCTAIYSIVYFVLFLSMKEMPYGNLGGKGTLMPISSVSVRCLMIFGMIILGLYLKIGAKNNGDTFNT